MGKEGELKLSLSCHFIILFWTKEYNRMNSSIKFILSVLLLFCILAGCFFVLRCYYYNCFESNEFSITEDEARFTLARDILMRESENYGNIHKSVIKAKKKKRNQTEATDTERKEDVV